MAENNMDPAAIDSLSVAPGSPNEGDAPNAGNSARDPRQDAGRDESIDRRLQRDPESAEAKLDAGLDESMDASDPIAATQPAKSTEPPASSGYDPEAESARRND
jgi:hypothetical protein